MPPPAAPQAKDSVRIRDKILEHFPNAIVVRSRVCMGVCLVCVRACVCACACACDACSLTACRYAVAIAPRRRSPSLSCPRQVAANSPHAKQLMDDLTKISQHTERK